MNVDVSFASIGFLQASNSLSLCSLCFSTSIPGFLGSTTRDHAFNRAHYPPGSDWDVMLLPGPISVSCNHTPAFQPFPSSTGFHCRKNDRVPPYPTSRWLAIVSDRPGTILSYPTQCIAAVCIEGRTSMSSSCHPIHSE